MVATADRIYLTDRPLPDGRRHRARARAVQGPGPHDARLLLAVCRATGDTLFGYADAPDTARHSWAYHPAQAGPDPVRARAVDRGARGSAAERRTIRSASRSTPRWPSARIGSTSGRARPCRARRHHRRHRLDRRGARLKPEETWWEGVAHDGEVDPGTSSTSGPTARRPRSRRGCSRRRTGRASARRSGAMRTSTSVRRRRSAARRPALGTAAGCIYATAAGNVSSAATAMPSRVRRDALRWVPRGVPRGGLARPRPGPRPRQQPHARLHLRAVPRDDRTRTGGRPRKGDRPRPAGGEIPGATPGRRGGAGDGHRLADGPRRSGPHGRDAARLVPGARRPWEDPPHRHAHRARRGGRPRVRRIN